MFIKPEQDEYKKDIQPTKITKRITKRVKGVRKKEIGRKIETTVSTKGKATQKTVIEFEKGKKLKKEIFLDGTLAKVEKVFSSRHEMRKILKELKQFCYVNARVRITIFGSKRIVIDDISKDIEDEEM